MPRQSVRLAEKEARAAIVRAAVLEHIDLRDAILEKAILEGRLFGADENAHRTPNPSKLKMWGKVQTVCKSWLDFANAQPDILRKVLGAKPSCMLEVSARCCAFLFPHHTDLAPPPKG